MYIPKYPQDFFDYSEGVNISDNEINEWIKRCIDKLEDNPNETYWSIASGNTYVEVFKNTGVGVKYDILVSKSYADAFIEEE